MHIYAFYFYPESKVHICEHRHLSFSFVALKSHQEPAQIFSLSLQSYTNRIRQTE